MLTLSQAQSVAQALGVEVETLATNGHTGMVAMVIPNFTAEEAKACITEATEGIELDWRSVYFVNDLMEDSSLPVLTITITTEN